MHPASVDAFHSFLVSLTPGRTGHYWALIAALLSVQCRDKVALQVIKRLMAACPNGIDDISHMNEATLLPLVKSCNFCNTKAKNIITATAQIKTLFHGQVPSSYKSLLKLHGVGPKIAHLMRSVSFGIEETGIVVDTHVHRVAAAMGWTSKAKLPEDSRIQLQRWVPKEEWVHFTLSVVGFGQCTKKKNWRDRFLQFAKEQGEETLVVGCDIVDRLVTTGKIQTEGMTEENMRGMVLELDCPWNDSKRIENA
jgi:endonuclease-3